MLFDFDQFELDLGTCELRLEGRVVPLQPRVFTVLRYLVEHRDRVVSKQELIDSLWGGEKVNAGAVPWTINRLRSALEDETHPPRYIQTARGHGYRFIGEVSARASRSEIVPAGSTRQAPQAPAVEDPFVGRDAILQQLMAAVDAAGENNGKLYLLTGEAGIGKTRCANELALLARRRGLQVWLGRCFDPGMAPAFWPFIQVLRAACNDTSVPEQLHRDAEALLRELEPQATPTSDRGLGLGESRFWLLDRICRWLVRSSRPRLRLLVIEDLHWADESSIQVLSMLAPLLEHARILVIATARDEQSDSRHAELALSARMRPCEQIALTGLRIEDVQAFLRPTLGVVVAAQLSPALSARTRGNPLFMREIARVLRAQWEREGSLRVEDVKLPAAVKDLIVQRLQALDTPARALLDAACVIGEEFTLPVLQRVSELDAALLLRTLQSAVAAHIIAGDDDPSKFSFTHPLMREVLYAGLPAALRTLLHAQVGLALEALGLVEPRLHEIAFHFHRASIDRYAAQAARYGRMAGDAAMRARAWPDAAELYAWALAAQVQLDPTDVQAICELLLQRAAALTFHDRRAEARKQCERAVELARQAGLAPILVRAAHLLRPSVWMAHLPDSLAQSALEEALRIAPESAVAERVRAYAQLSVLPPCSLQLSKSRALSERAVELARRANDAALLCEAQRAQLFGLSGADTIDALLHTADEILRNDPIGASRWSADAQLARYNGLLRRGDVDAAERALDALDRIAVEARARMMGWHSDRLRAQRLLAAGKLDEAERRFDALKAEGERLHLPLAEVFYRAQAFALTYERSGRRVPTIFDERPQAQSFILRSPAFRVHHVLQLIETRELARASDALRTLAEDDFSAVTEDTTALYCLTRLACAAASLRERDTARALLGLLTPYAELTALNLFSISVGCVARYLGLLERCLGRTERALEHYDTAMKIDARTGQELERMRAALAYAHLLPDKKRARALVNEVRTSAEACGALPLSAAANRLAARLGDGSTAALRVSKPA